MKVRIERRLHSVFSEEKLAGLGETAVVQW